jgi:hypothetical protein
LFVACGRALELDSQDHLMPRADTVIPLHHREVPQPAEEGNAYPPD